MLVALVACTINFFDRSFGSPHPEIFNEIDQVPSIGILMEEVLYNSL
jgi:hypothetical protein